MLGAVGLLHSSTDPAKPWTIVDAQVGNQGRTVACAVHMIVHMNVDFRTAASEDPKYKVVTVEDACVMRRVIAHNLITNVFTAL